MPRETIDEKADRLLVSNRVKVIGNRITVVVRGDTGAHTVRGIKGEMGCDCKATTECSHIRAVKKIWRTIDG